MSLWTKPYYFEWEGDEDEVETAVNSHNYPYGNNAFFSLFGIQMTRQPDRGIYIQNGKKYIIK